MPIRRLALVLPIALLLAPLASASNQPLKPGFTKKIPGVGWARQGRPAIANLGFGGKKSIVFGTSGTLPAGQPGGVPTAGGWLVVVNADGSVPAGFPVQLPSEVNTPAAGDLDGNGVDDVIVVGYGSTFAGSSVPGGIAAIRTNGTHLSWSPRPGRDFNSDGVAEAVYATPAIADVDDDGRLEVAWGGYDGWVYLVDLETGADEAGWPIFVKDTIWSSPSLHDLNGDGRKEIVIGVDSHPDTVLGVPTPPGGCLWAFQSTGAVLPGFPYCVSMVIWSAPAIGDIDGDDLPEIVFGTGNCPTGTPCAPGPGYVFTHKLYAVERDGTDTPGWPATVEGEVHASPALGDIDGDGALEVVAVDFPTASGGKSHVYAWEGNGVPIFKTVLKDVSGIDAYGGGDPVIGDVAGDSRPEIVVPYNWEPVVVSPTGTVLTSLGGLDYSTWGPVASVAVGDLESDGSAIELVAPSSTFAQTGSLNETEVWVWSPKVSSTPPWGMFHQGSNRLGVLPGTPTPPPPTPPTVTGVAPATGTTEGGTVVTISGTLFAAGASVAFGAAAASNVSVSSSTSLTATTPAGAAGAVAVTVTNRDGGSGSLPAGFTYVAPPLTLTSASPRVGPTSGGTLVSLAGTGFASGATVRFRGTLSAQVTRVSSTLLRAAAPAGSVGPADIVVSNPGGASSALPGGFLYTATGTASRTFTVTPCRVVDTRNATGSFGAPALAPLASRSFNIPAGACGIPTDAVGVSLNVTVADATGAGELTFFPGAGTVPGTTTVVFRPGKNRANNAQVGLVGGVLTVYNHQTTGTVNLIIDVNGYFR